jgi:C1A family cysteine protease
MNSSFHLATEEQKRFPWAKAGLVAALGALAVIAGVAALSNSSPDSLSLRMIREEQKLFNSWMQEHNKEYNDNSEYTHRFKTFRDNWAYIRLHNKQNHSYQLGLNQFADMTYEEFRATMLSPLHPQQIQDFKDNTEPFETPEIEAPTSLDWRTKGRVNPVKNQGYCGSCWAFSSNTALEAAAYVKSGNRLLNLSEQQLVDCSFAQGNSGCNGGWFTNAWSYVYSKGIELASAYPYTSGGSGAAGTCKENSALYQPGAKVSSCYWVKGGDANMITAVNINPLVVAIDATNNFMLYKSGTFTDTTCSTTAPNHGIAIVGYTPTEWIIRNSWDTTWGNQGYALIKRDGTAAGVCGINNYVYYPKV